MFKPYNFGHLKSVSESSTLAPGLSEERFNLGTYHAPLIKNRGWGPNWDTCGHFHHSLFTGEDHLCLSGEGDWEGGEKQEERKEKQCFMASKMETNGLTCCLVVWMGLCRKGVR